MREVADERVDLSERERGHRLPFDVLAHEAVRRDPDGERHRARVVDGERAVLLRETEQPHDATDAGLAIATMDLGGDRADVFARDARACEQLHRRRRRLSRLVLVAGLVTAASLRQVLAQKFARPRIEHAHAAVIPLHVQHATDVARRRGVVRAIDLHVPIEVDRALAVSVVAKRLDRQR